ncbi:DUF6255 family natural product biosynthesis protein [Streptomyces olivoreticuli]
MATCAHRAGWVRGKGEARCGSCGVVRFTEYGALRPPGLAEAVKPSQGGSVDRAAALWVMRRTRRRTEWWGAGPSTHGNAHPFGWMKC